jgi:hypothetical protein
MLGPAGDSAPSGGERGGETANFPGDMHVSYVEKVLVRAGKILMLAPF